MHLASLRPTSTFLAAACVGCASLLACAPANAGDYQAKRVAADARWLAFIDVEGILKSNLGKFITEHGGELGVEFGEGDMEEIQAELGINPLKDLHSITVYGAGNPDEDMHMVALLETTAAVDDAVAKITGATEAQKAEDDDDDDDEKDDISVIELNGQKVHVFSDGDEDTYYVQVRPGPNSASRLVVVSMDRDWMTKGLSVLDGKSPSVAGADKPGINFKPDDGTLAFAVCNDLSWIAEHHGDDHEPASAILKGAKGIEFAYGESGEDLFFNARLDTGSAEDAQNLSDMVRGLVAMAKYAGSKEPELKPLMEPMRSLELKTEGASIVLRLKHNTEELIKALSAMAEASSGDGDDDDEDVEKVEVKAEVKVGSDEKDNDN